VTYAIRLCGGDFRPGARDTCPDELHDYPLPDGYVDAGEAAMSRLARGWVQRKCPRCRLYGWVPGRQAGKACDERVTAKATGEEGGADGTA
jgi:hypothetical protein